jgi:hypothetical protein
MKQHVFHLLSWISVALCVATVVMWVRSFAFCDWIAMQRVQRYSLGSSNGELVGATTEAEREIPRPPPRSIIWEFGVFSDPRGIPLRPPSYLGFGAGSVRRMFEKSPRSNIRSLFTRLVMVPYWAIASPLGVLPALAVWPDLRRRRRLLTGQCGECGYDLRGVVEGCPECRK